MEKKIITIGYVIPGYSDQYSAFSSNQSILDAEIVVFAPDFTEYAVEGRYEGKLLYNREASIKLLEDSRRWREELQTVLEAGKTVFVFFKGFEVFYLRDKYSIENTYYDNYRFFPIPLPTIVPRQGEEIVFSKHPVFSSIWDIFEEYFRYESYLDGAVETPIFTTRTAEKVVGALFKVGNGNLVLLPVLDYDEDEFIDHDPQENEKFWNEKATEFGSKLIKAFVKIDKTLRNDGTRTTPPDWAEDEDFQLAQEQTMKEEVERKSETIRKLKSERRELLEKINKESELRGLLFETGKALEKAVISALEILGYEAKNYNDGNLELDQVIISPDGDRFIGETEGKDKSAVGKDKLRQLITNTMEDFDRDEIEKRAVGILFGNGFRLANPSERKELFTDSCLELAKHSNCILVRTTDLFRVVKYVRESGDDDFAKRCRDSIKNSVDKIVEFPSIPKK